MINVRIIVRLLWIWFNCTSLVGKCLFFKTRVNYCWHTWQVSTVLDDSHLQSVNFWSFPPLDGVVLNDSIPDQTRDWCSGPPHLCSWQEEVSFWSIWLLWFSTSFDWHGTIISHMFDQVLLSSTTPSSGGKDQKSTLWRWLSSKTVETYQVYQVYLWFCKMNIFQFY